MSLTAALARCPEHLPAEAQEGGPPAELRPHCPEKEKEIGLPAREAAGIRGAG